MITSKGDLALLGINAMTIPDSDVYYNNTPLPCLLKLLVKDTGYNTLIYYFPAHTGS